MTFAERYQCARQISLPENRYLTWRHRHTGKVVDVVATDGGIEGFVRLQGPHKRVWKRTANMAVDYEPVIEQPST